MLRIPPRLPPTHGVRPAWRWWRAATATLPAVGATVYDTATRTGPSFPLLPLHDSLSGLIRQFLRSISRRLRTTNHPAPFCLPADEAITCHHSSLAYAGAPGWVQRCAGCVRTHESVVPRSLLVVILPPCNGANINVYRKPTGTRKFTSHAHRSPTGATQLLGASLLLTTERPSRCAIAPPDTHAALPSVHPLSG